MLYRHGMIERNPIDSQARGGPPISKPTQPISSTEVKPNRADGSRSVISEFPKTALQRMQQRIIKRGIRFFRVG